MNTIKGIHELSQSHVGTEIVLFRSRTASGGDVGVLQGVTHEIFEVEDKDRGILSKYTAKYRVKYTVLLGGSLFEYGESAVWHDFDN